MKQLIANCNTRITNADFFLQVLGHGLQHWATSPVLGPGYSGCVQEPWSLIDMLLLRDIVWSSLQTKHCRYNMYVPTKLYISVQIVAAQALFDVDCLRIFSAYE